MFAALHLKGVEDGARILEGPVPDWKLLFPWDQAVSGGSGGGAPGKTYGLRRYGEAEFASAFPFARVNLRDGSTPVSVEITGWSPFIPGDDDASSLPVAALEYTFQNASSERLDATFSFHSANFMRSAALERAIVRPVDQGFVLENGGDESSPHEEGHFCVAIDNPGASVNCAWFRGGWFDTLSEVWRGVESGESRQAGPPDEGGPSPGCSLSLRLRLAARDKSTVRLRLCWYVPVSDLSIGGEYSHADAPDRTGKCTCSAVGERTYRPWYAGEFTGIDELNRHWESHYQELRDSSEQFSDCMSNSTLPAEVVDAVSANLGILKSPTVLRQTDGRLWAFEGCSDMEGCCPGSTTHVWNYAQALPHLFPALERTLRATEFGENQNSIGHQAFRGYLPIAEPPHDFLAAADGQLGGIMKVHREWMISGDDDWLSELWPLVRSSLDYCIETWDPEHRGILVEPHHNTYDIEFWGPDSMCSSIYLGALKAACLMGQALGDECTGYDNVYRRGRAYIEEELFNGEYFHQWVQWKGLRAQLLDSLRFGYEKSASPEETELVEREGPKYQYGPGCLSDGVIGAWLAGVCGVGEILDSEKVESHLLSVYKYNFKRELSAHANPQRSTFALGSEGGLLLCTWPRGGEPELPFIYSKEVWTGVEYQVASHLMMFGHVQKGVDIVRTARARYDGRVRNPFDEIECGHWYARAMASYALIQGLTGFWYDRRSRVLRIRPQIEGDFSALLATDAGYGMAGVRNGEPFVDVVQGSIEIDRIDFQPKGGKT